MPIPELQVTPEGIRNVPVSARILVMIQWWPYVTFLLLFCFLFAVFIFVVLLFSGGAARYWLEDLIGLFVIHLEQKHAQLITHKQKVYDLYNEGEALARNST